ncbi:MAG: fatty acid desaturase, partial [Deltaproteobacteria bacterium]|nr:fatty acid desaturase [Deltaproteobacteria bacterium]
RDHHRFSDTEEDIHSPKKGFWWSHVGWILARRYHATAFDKIKDFTKFPELVWLDRFHLVPTVAYGVAWYLIGGWTAVFWCHFVSTVLLWHGTFLVNSLSHVWGTRRYETTDTSRNNLWIALVTSGEGWHNNHHHHLSSANQGFFWWEVDPSFYVIKVWEKLGLVWDVKMAPAKVVGDTIAARERAVEVKLAA